MPYYSDELIGEVRLANDIVNVISDYVRLQKKGSTHFGLCPFHNEKTPSFSVSQGKQMYYCFGCGAGGNVITFVMEYENYSFVEAVKLLADRAGITLPEAEYSKEARAQADLKNTLLEINRLAANYFYYQLKQPNGRIGYEYFKNRALTDDTIRHFGLGYANKVPDDLYRYMRSKGYEDSVLKETGLFFIEERGARDKFWNRVMFPILDVNKRVIGFGGRVMGDGEPKYLNSPETKLFDKSRNLYGLNFARTSRAGYILICEGYMDVIAMHQAGFTNAVASLGTAFTPQHALLLKRYTDQVILTYDSDEAGVRAALRAIPILKEAGITAKIINMEPYKDPDEFIKARGPEAFQERIDQAESSFFFELRMLERGYDFSDPQSKTAFFTALSERLLLCEPGVERKTYTEAAAKRYDLTYDQLSAMVNRIGRKSGELRRAPAPVPQAAGQKRKKTPEDANLRSQRLLITWMSSDERTLRNVCKYLEPEDFTDPLCRKVAELLTEQRMSGRLNPASLFQYFTEEDDQQKVSAMLYDTIPKLSGKEEEEKALQETIRRVKLYSIAWQAAHVDPNDLKKLQEILLRRREIEKLHISLD